MKQVFKKNKQQQLIFFRFHTSMNKGQLDQFFVSNAIFDCPVESYQTLTTSLAYGGVTCYSHKYVKSISIQSKYFYVDTNFSISAKRILIIIHKFVRKFFIKYDDIFLFHFRPSTLHYPKTQMTTKPLNQKERAWSSSTNTNPTFDQPSIKKTTERPYTTQIKP